MSSTIRFNLDQSKIFSSGKGLSPLLSEHGSCIFMPPVSVCLSFCPSICPELNHKTLHLPFTRLMFGMKEHLIDTHLLEPRSRSSAKVKDKYQGHISIKKKIVVSGVIFFFFSFYYSCRLDLFE